MRLTAYCITKDAGEGLPKTLDSVKSIADEIVVVDTGSSDNTLEVAKRYTDKVYVHPRADYWREHPEQFHFSEARNYALERCTGDWILSMDCDEVLEPESASKLKTYLDNLPSDIDLLLVTMVMCHDDGRPYQEFLAERLLRNGRGLRFIGGMHNWVDIPGKPNAQEGRLAEPSLRIRHNRTQNAHSTRDARGLQRIAMAEYHFLKEIEEDPNNRRAMFYLAGTYYDSGQTDKAIHWFERYMPISDFNSERYQAAILLAHCYLTKDDTKRARQVLGEHIIDNWQRAEGLLMLGQIAMAEGDMAQAEWWFKAASLKPKPVDPLFVEHDAHTWQPHFQLWALYEQIKRYDLAARHAEEAIKQGSPADPIRWLKNHTDYKSDRILCLVDRGQMDFIQPLIDSWKREGKTVEVATEVPEKIDADIVWCEWAGVECVKLTNLPEKKWRTIVRVIGYEANTGLLPQVNWANVDDAIFLTEDLKQQVTEQVPHIESICNNYVIQCGVDTCKFEIAADGRELYPGTFVRSGDLRLDATRYADILTQTQGTEHYSRPYEFAWIRDKLHEGEKVLDVGVGEMPYEKVFLEKTPNITIQDIYQKALDIQKQHYPNLETILGGDLGDEIFDTVACVSVLEHVEDRQSLAAAMFRALKPGGRLLITCDIPRISVGDLTKLLDCAGFVHGDMPADPPDDAIGGVRTEQGWLRADSNPELRVYRIECFKPTTQKTGKKLAMLGYVNVRKNMPLALQILAKLPKEYELHIAGEWQDGELLHYVQHIGVDMGLEGRLFIYGRVPDANAFFADKDFILSTSVRETFHCSVAEGMAAGLKPVVHNWAGARSIYPDEFIFKTVDEAVTMIQGEHKPQEYRMYALEHLGVDKTAQRVKRIIRKPNVTVWGRRNAPAYGAGEAFKRAFAQLGCCVDGDPKEADIVFMLGNPIHGFQTNDPRIEPWMDGKYKIWWADDAIGDSERDTYGALYRARLMPYIDLWIAQNPHWLDRLRTEGAKRVEWVPLCGALPPFRKLNEPKLYDVGFFGSTADRRGPILEKLGETLEVHGLQDNWDHEQVNVFINRCKVTVNLHAYEDERIEWRIFESLAAGTCVVSEPTPIGREIPGVIQTTDLSGAIHGLLDSGKWQEMGREGHEWVWNKFRFERQVEKVLELAGL